MSTQSDRDVVVKARAALEDSILLIAVPVFIDALLKVPAPKGDGGSVTQLAKGFDTGATTTDNIAVQVTKVASQDLPEVWVGVAAEKAGEVVVAVAEDLERAAGVFGKARTVLDVLAIAFTDAHKKHTDAQDPLHQARNAADHGDYGAARNLGLAGADLLLSAFDTVLDAGQTAARDLAALADQARAHQLNSGNLSSSDRLVLGESAVPGGPHDLNLILNETDAQRAAQQLDRLSPADRERVDQLLGDAKSPQERAYLMRTLAAGHSVDDVSSFDNLIHDHGDDPMWLQEHLTPIVSTGAQHADITYRGASWTQGQYPTCVASSTIMARAMVDPVYTLQLTTGNKPDDPAATGPEAFKARLRTEQQSVYDHGRSGRDDDRNWLQKLVGYHDDTPGMYANEGQQIANEDIGEYNGQSYQHQDVSGSAADRSSVLPSVESAVDQGKPVPIQVEGDGKGHQMMVIGHQGDKLEIYNPWGDITWVSEDDFVNGHMDKVDPGVPPNVRGVLMPK